MVSGDKGSADTFTAMQVFWWERRRILYNSLLLVIGLFSIAGMEYLLGAVVPLGEDAVEPAILFLGIALYGCMANVCYSLGWIVELSQRRNDPLAARRRGRWMFRAGLLFSCVLTTAPFFFACAIRVAHWLVAPLHRTH